MINYGSTLSYSQVKSLSNTYLIPRILFIELTDPIMPLHRLAAVSCFFLIVFNLTPNATG